MNHRLLSGSRTLSALALGLLMCLYQGVASAQVRLSLTDLSGQLEAANQAIAALSQQTAALSQQTLALQAQVSAQNSLISDLQTQNQALAGKLGCVAPSSTSTNLVFSGCNVQLVNGAGSTQTMNGLGNLIVGYNEDAATQSKAPSVRTGSHNIVTGLGHSYTSAGGLVAGRLNTISGLYASVTGGSENSATAAHSSVTGGNQNVASQPNSIVLAGQQNQALAPYSSVTAGFKNQAKGAHSSVSGGMTNIATGQLSNVSGGMSRSAGDLGWAAGDLFSNVP